jgi:hypothetical protein
MLRLLQSALLSEASQGFVLLLPSLVKRHIAGAGEGVGAGGTTYGLSTLPVLLEVDTGGV